jgi:hypothetical protein
VGDYGGLILLVVVAVPVALFLLFVRRPYDRMSTPRDAMASRAKSEAKRALGILPNKAFDDLMRDDSPDQPSSGD